MRPAFLGTLGGRLTGLFTLLVAVLSVSLYLTVLTVLEAEARADLDAKARSLASVTAFTVRSALVFDDSVAAREAILGTLASPDVVRVFVRDQDGTPVAQASSAGVETLEYGSLIVASEPVRMGGVELGRVEVAISPEVLSARLVRARSITALVALGVLALGVGLVIVLASRLARPLQEAVAMTRAITQGDLGRRLPEHTGPSELRELAGSFNVMAERLGFWRSEIERSKRHLEQILDSAPAGVAVFDLDLRCIYVNSSALPDPVARRESAGKTPAALWPAAMDSPAAERIADALRRAVTEGRVTTAEETVPLGDGVERSFIFRFNLLRSPDGAPWQVVAYAIDISGRRRAEQELRAREEQLRQAQKMEAVGRLAGGIAHDFNNLLTAIGGHAELAIAELPGPEPALESLAEIRENAQRAASLTRQLLAFSRRQVLAPRVFDVGVVVDGLRPMLRRLIGEDIALEFARTSDVPPVRADPGQMEQIVMNLVVNARDAMPRGGRLEIALDARRPEGRSPDETWIRLLVRDTGCGMDETTVQRIFEPFFTTKELGQGTGLGLATVYGIVQQSGGVITVASTPGRGTTFEIFLPGAAGGHAPAETAANPAAPRCTHPGATILLVEDEPGVRAMASQFLRRAGYEVVEASSAEDALRWAERNPAGPDLLLTDVVMPGRSGGVLAQTLRRSRPTLRVLYMSGYTDDAIVRHGLSIGTAELVDKPFDSRTLLDRVATLLETAPAAAGAGEEAGSGAATPAPGP